MTRPPFRRRTVASPSLLVLISGLVLAWAGCASEEQAGAPSGEEANGPRAAAGQPAAEGTSDLSRDLLAGAESGAGALSDSAAPGSLPPGPPLANPPAAGGQEGPRVIDIANLGYDAGSDDAPVRVIEFSDFGCGYCRQFHLETYPTLEEEYIATGKVEWKYIPVVIGRFGPSAELAAEAGECAGEQGRFAPVRDRIFQLQGEWQRAPNPMPLFSAVAQESGVDLGRWEQCVNEGWRSERVRAGTQLGFQAGLQGTPTFLIVGFTMLPGAIPLDLFRQVLDSALVIRGQGQGAGR